MNPTPHRSRPILLLISGHFVVHFVAHFVGIGRFSTKCSTKCAIKQISELRIAEEAKHPSIPTTSTICAWKCSGEIGSLAVVLFLLAAGPPSAAALEFVRQTIALPDNPRGWQGWRMSCFVDLDHDGLLDLLVIAPAGSRLLIYRQHPAGFADVPDQSIELPKDTSWIAPVELDPTRGVDLVLSSASGLGCLRQNQGVFEPLVHPLVQVQQGFPGSVRPVFITLTNHSGTGSVRLPVITPEQIVWFQNTNGHRWSPQPPLSLHPARAFWSLEEGQWAAGSSPARTLSIWNAFRTNAEASSLLEPKPENEAIKQLLHKMEDRWHGVERVDVDGDGRDDVVVWQAVGDLDPRTDLFVFLRGEQFPARPTQVLHCRGFPVLGPSSRISPLCRLTSAPTYELVLLTLKTAITSSSGLVDMAMTRGIDWALTIRTFRHGAYAQNPDAAIPLTSAMPEGDKGASFLFSIDGDFNGDGRRDILVRRTVSQWDLILSSADRAWFKPTPAASLEIPAESDFEVMDLNHDGLADLIALNHPAESARLCIFLSQATRAGGKRK